MLGGWTRWSDLQYGRLLRGACPPRDFAGVLGRSWAPSGGLSSLSFKQGSVNGQL